MARLKRCAWVALILCTMWGSALAFTLDQAAPAKASDGISFSGMLKGAGIGAMAGLTVALLGYAKDQDPNKKIDLKQAAPTVLIGIVLGFFSGWDNIDLTKWKEWKESAATVLVGELMFKAGWRNFSPPVSSGIQKFLGRKSES